MAERPDDGRLIIRGDSGDFIIADAGFFPVLITTWFGAASAPAVRDYFRWVHQMGARARTERTPLVNITDAGLSGVPAASVRRLIADETKGLDRAGFRSLPMHSITVVDSVVVRGALTAIAWIHGDMAPETVGTRVEALDRALAILRPLRVSLPGLVAQASARPRKPG